MLPLIGDEAIRAVVTLEMMLSGDYITPTLTGEIYLNKPPLFNWILAAFFKLFNGNSEVLVRLPTTLFLLIYCITIYWWVRRELGQPIGWMAALLFLTCGRILFWDSFLGLIDITYSWIMFVNFMVIWHYYRKESYMRLFILSYLLTAIGFLMKGLPTLAFEAITLGVVFIYGRRFRVLVSWKHLAGVGLFVLVTGVYYLLYYLKNPAYLESILLRLVTESTQKSAIGTGLGKTVLHLFAFPFELIYHFVPWMLLVIFLFHKKIFTKVFSNDFVRYCVIVFSANMLIYWFSPVTYPRYLLMLVPLIFIVFLYAGRFHSFTTTLNYRVVRIVFISIMAGLSSANVVLPVIFAGQLPVDHLYLKVFLVLVAEILVLSGILSNQKGPGLFYYTGMILLISRISFNLFLVPYRQSESWLTLCREDAIELAGKTKGEELYYMTDTITIHNVYYLTRERNDILRHKDTPSGGPYFIVNDTMLFGQGFEKELSMRIPYNYSTYYAGKFKMQP
jgi:4-amino-4-deoxy-L-arabinose transferase-like glycosyltransferase